MYNRETFFIDTKQQFYRALVFASHQFFVFPSSFSRLSSSFVESYVDIQSVSMSSTTGVMALGALAPDCCTYHSQLEPENS
ncbi:hypothetical protein RSAG8_10960, partial [Rhizoctonia solani AG-8 WAC10335]